MNSLRDRAYSRSILIFVSAAFTAFAPAAAAGSEDVAVLLRGGDVTHPAEPDATGNTHAGGTINAALGLEEATRLAIARQPLLEAQANAVTSAREDAIAAAQLPDPKLNVGLLDWPVNGPDEFSFRDDNFTMLTVGMMQEFPRAEKRRLRGERGRRESSLAQEQLNALTLSIGRDVALGWLDVWRAERAAALAHASAGEADLQAQEVDIAYRSARASEAELFAARVAFELARDEVADLEQQAAQARNALSRWIGSEAGRPLPADLPDWKPPPELDALLTALEGHPLVKTADAQTEVARTDVELAKAANRPDWAVGLYYANRFEFPDYVGVNFTVDLPFFTGQRQDRSLAARLEDKRRAQQMREDLLRQQAAATRIAREDWQRLQERLSRYAEEILPQSAQRIEAARLAWRAGQGALAAVLDARRVDLENRMKHLELQTQAARSRVSLQYFAGELP